MELPEALGLLFAGQDLAQEQSAAVMRQIMTGQATDAQIGALLAALRMKGETVAEISGAALVMRELSTPVTVADHSHLVDTCGTGGDGAGLFNVSTGSAFVVAAAGGQVAKHGNRSISGSSGSADVLEAAGVPLDLRPEQVARCIEQVGIGFMFAPSHHAAMKHAAGPRRELRQRTLFNLLGPLTNPAQAPHQLLGVFDRRWCRPLAEALGELGSRHALVVHSEDGLDEISCAAGTWVAELRHGQLQEYRIHPEQFQLPCHPLSELRATTPQESLEIIDMALKGRHEAAADMLALNAGAAIYAAGRCATLAQGVAMAQDALAAGLAAEKLQEFLSFLQAMQADRS